MCIRDSTSTYQPLIADVYGIQKINQIDYTQALHNIGSIVNLRIVTMDYESATGRALLNLSSDIRDVLEKASPGNCRQGTAPAIPKSYSVPFMKVFEEEGGGLEGGRGGFFQKVPSSPPRFFHPAQKSSAPEEETGRCRGRRRIQFL